MLPIIKPFALKEDTQKLSYKVSLSALPRLKDILSSTVGEVKVDFEFFKNGYGLNVNVSAKAMLLVLCQRCLQDMPYELNLSHDLLLTKTDFDYENYDGDFVEVINGDLSLLDCLEDEIILELPLINRHNNETCHAKIDPETTLVESTIKTYKPFANLKELRGN